MRKKNIAILGSTGSIGINTLNVVDRFRDRFNVVALSAFSNKALLEQQQAKYKPKHVALGLDNAGALVEFASLKEVDIVVLALRGAGALAPFLAAAKAGKVIAPANKEALVIAGDLLMETARRHKAMIIPVDSEQSAIFQCIDGQKAPVHKVHLTASGGPLRTVAAKDFKDVTVDDILRHPRWKMGAKITVDSATLFNKGFEFIEAQRLFGLRHDQIEVVVHPQAIIHSMVEFEDGSILAQLGVTDMRLPIQYALTYPDRWPTGIKRIDFAELKTLDFQHPDFKRFPALQLCMDVAKVSGTAASVLNAADEEAVEAFLKGKIAFNSIYKVVEKVVSQHKIIRQPDLKEIIAADVWAREESRHYLTKVKI